jgi:hypothetical protein
MIINDWQKKLNIIYTLTDKKGFKLIETYAKNIGKIDFIFLFIVTLKAERAVSSDG